MEEDGEELPDHLRCSRTDGRQWRCVRRVMNNRSLCEAHHLQARHRQYKQKVPECLKLQRKTRRNRIVNEESLGPRPSYQERALAKLLKKKSGRSLVLMKAAFHKALMNGRKLKMGGLLLELMRVFLQRQMERRKKKKKKRRLENSVRKGELVLDLPNGLMAISSAPVPSSRNAGFFCDRKLGLDSGSLIRRCIRSKNIEPLQFGSLKVVPYGRNVAGLKQIGKKNCHQCGTSNLLSLIWCSSCQTKTFCMACIRDWYSEMPEAVMMSCPVCCGTCNCKRCLSKRSKDEVYKDMLRGQNNVNKILNFHYLVCLLLPVLKQINQEQRIELEIEAKIKGKTPFEIQIQQVGRCHGEQLRCDNCKTYIVDFHRSCSNCSYELCLSCCQEVHQGRLPGSNGSATSDYFNKGNAYVDGCKPLPEIKTKQSSSFKQRYGNTLLVSSMGLSHWEVNNEGGCISCPSEEFGGCGKNILDLKCVFPSNWIAEMEIRAEEIACSYEFPETLDASQCPCTHDRDGELKKKLQKASTREDSDDNFLYCPTGQEIQDDLEHFQKHWSKGQPVIVRDVLHRKLDLSWDPLVMFQTLVERSTVNPQKDIKLVKATDCLDWCEVEIGIQQFFRGYLEGRTHSNFWPEMLRLKDWPSPKWFQEQFPTHIAEFIHALPFQEYTNPKSGILNLAARTTEEFSVSALSPRVYISYGIAEELGRGDSVTKLYFDSSDVVNVLVHTIEVASSAQQLEKIKRLKKKHKAQDEKDHIKSYLCRKIIKQMYQEPSLAFESMEEAGGGEEKMDATGGEHQLSNGFTGVTRNSSVTVIPQEHDTVIEDEVKFDILENTSDSGTGSNSYRSTNSSGKTGENLRQDASDESPSGIERKLVDSSCGAHWDVFRREDVPKLQHYLIKHSNEFRHTYCSPIEHVVHPILDQCFFLDSTHKRRLKEEFKVEPWSFYQHLGEAVFVPAGCPYQIRNLKSCVNLELDFVSPESVGECIKLIDEFRKLPEDHKAKQEGLEVKKMSLYNISAAIKEIGELTSSTVNGNRTQ